MANPRFSRGFPYSFSLMPIPSPVLATNTVFQYCPSQILILHCNNNLHPIHERVNPLLATSHLAQIVNTLDKIVALNQNNSCGRNGDCRVDDGLHSSGTLFDGGKFGVHVCVSLSGD